MCKGKGRSLDMKSSEREPLLGKRLGAKKINRDPRRTFSETVLYQRQKTREDLDLDEPTVGLKRHITLVDSVGIIVGNVIGSGIFLSPKGVYANIGSVGGCLLVWGLMGIYALTQALCYAELGVGIPRAGGDYAYVFHILGPLPAFLCVWVQMVIIATSSNGIIAQTAGTYLLQPLGLQCYPSMSSGIAILIIVAFAAVNIASSRLGTKVQLLFSTAKVIALCIIIVTGIVMLIQGNTANFQNGFEGTSTNPGAMALSALDGYFAYKGWELVNALPEEMINPKRDLPMSVWMAMLLVTVTYVLTNVAYFTVLTSDELLESDAVALTFIKQTLGEPTSWLISTGVALSCMGTINGSFLGDTRYLFAAGRTRQVPPLFSMIHCHYLTPVAAVVVVCFLSIIYSLIPSVEQLQQYTSLAVQLKILTGLVSLIYLRWKRPNLHTPFKIPMLIILLVVVVMVTLIGLSIYQNPSTAGVGLGIFVLGVPVYYVINCLRKVTCTGSVVDEITIAAQKLFLVVPEADQKPDPIQVRLPPESKPPGVIPTS